jgi:Ran GTPase-activating protein (RanGAP) involved in mRNA processing and transport
MNGLQQNTSLKEIDLSNNGIDAIGARLLMRGMANHPSITKLYLSNNRNIGYQGLCYIGNELPNLRIKELDLKECTLREADPSLLVTIASQREAGQALVNGIKENLYLTHLTLSDWALPTGFNEELEFYMDLNRSGRYLLGSNHGLAPAIWCRIFESLDAADEVGLIYYFLKEHPSLMSYGTCRKRKAIM